ncbi:hypothetical protein KJ836_02355 [Patescibacteria group bacterium]|nr:hypothetical protein [Patescibacteria group bacterium]
MVDFKIIATKPKYAVRIGKVLSKSPSASGFSTALVYRPDLPEEQKHGSIYFVIDIGSASPLAPDIAYNLIDIIKEEYYRDLSLGPAQSFEVALKAANEEFAAIAKEGEKDWIGKTNVTVAIVSSDKLMAVHRGTNELHLWRNGKMMHLSADMYVPGEMPRPEETLSNIIEGDLMVGDKIIASTAELLYYFSIDKIKRIIEDHSPAEAARELASQLEKDGDVSKTNLIIAEFTVPEMITEIEGTPEDNWVGTTSSDYGRKFAPNNSDTKSNYWGNDKPDVPSSVQPEPQAELSASIDAKTNDMAQELELTDDEPMAMVSPRRSGLGKLTLPKISIDYGQISHNLTQITNKAKLATKSPQFKKTGNFVVRYIKYAWLIMVAVVDLIFTTISYWVDEVKKQKHGNRVLLISVAVLAVVLVFSTITMANNNSAKISKKTAMDSLDSAIQNRDAAKAALIYEDKAKAGELLASAYTLAEAATKHDSTKKDAQIILADIESQLDEIGLVKRYANPRVLVDFDSLASQLESSSSKTSAKVTLDNFFTVGDDVYSYDTDYNKVYKYNYSKNEAGIINSLVSNEKKIKLASAVDNSIIVYTTPPSVYSLDLSDNRMSASNLDTGTWNNAVDLIAYTSKLYFLDPDNNQIWKYQRTADGYTKIASFFEDNSAISLAGATAFAIDGDMYILVNEVVNKYTLGQKVEFNLQGTPEHTGILGNIKDIYASLDTNGLFVLDPDNSRVIAFNKDGNYRKQYVFTGITNPTKIFVNEKIGSLWVLSGTQVYQLDL